MTPRNALRYASRVGRNCTTPKNESERSGNTGTINVLVMQRIMTTQICHGCRKTLPMEAFYRRKKGTEERQRQCKSCFYLKYNKMHERPTFYKTVVESPQWQAWIEHAEAQGFSTVESVELGLLSREHFQAFISFVKTL